MANTCDYCHKPLSLMRRLRGEQFCSVEHLDLYAAQQAEFALERLAASVTEKPNTERPPALIRPASAKAPRPAARMEGEPAAAPAAQPQQPAPTARVAVEPEPVQPDFDYPMAPHLGHNGIQPREYESEPRKGQNSPVVTWGRVTPTWAMPQFRTEPGDPRTWTAGKLVSQVPPVAGLRGLLESKAPLPSGEEVAAELDLAGVFDTQLPGWSARTSHEFSSLPAVRSEIALQAGLGLGATPDLTLRVGTADVVVRSVPAEFRNALDSAPTARGELRLRSASLPLHILEGPEFRPESLSNIALAGLGFPALEGAVSKLTGIAPATTPVSLDTSAPAAAPEAHYVLPEIGGWSWAPAFALPQVALPELLPRTTEPAVAPPETSWQDRTVTPEHPAMHWSGAHVGHAGPALEWQLSKPRVWSPELLPRPVEPSVAGRDPQWEHAGGGVQHPATQWSTARFGYSGPTFGWDASQLKLGAAESTVTESPQAPTADAPRVREFYAKLRAAIEPAARQTWKDWLALRMDASLITAEPITPTRSTVAVMDVRVRPLMPAPVSRFELVGHAVAEAETQPGHVPPPVPLNAAEPPVCGIQFRKLGVPTPSFPTVKTAQPLEPTAGELHLELEQAGPVKYSPRSILVVPPPQFDVKVPALHEEQRFVAQAPNGVWKLPKVRQTGYRALGPFPKLPIRVPDRYLQVLRPQIHGGFTDVPRKPMQSDKYLAGLPVIEKPQPAGIHPADYFAWPVPKGMKPERILPERDPFPARPTTAGPTRRFGPGRAGLQTKRGTADLSPRTGT